MSPAARFASAVVLSAACLLPLAASADPAAPAPKEGLVVIAISGPDEFGRGYSLVWRPVQGEGRCPALAGHGGFSAPETSRDSQPWRFRVVRVKPGRYALNSIAWIRMGFMTLSGEELVTGPRPVVTVGEGETVFAGAFKVREPSPRRPVAEPVTNIAPAEVNAAKLTAQPAIDRSGQKVETAGLSCK